MGKNAKGFALVVFAFQFTDIVFGLGRLSQEKHGRLFDGPFKVVVADFLVGMAGPFAVRLFSRAYQPCIGGDRDIP
jgi:hypothetical protein